MLEHANPNSFVFVTLLVLPYLARRVTTYSVRMRLWGRYFQS